MLKLSIHKKVVKEIQTFPKKHQKQIGLKIREILNLNGISHDEKKLKGYPFKRTDAGEYRIIFRVEGDTLEIAAVGKRNDNEIYRIFYRGKK
jgi:mRNA interferase RelE/StbE